MARFRRRSSGRRYGKKGFRGNRKNRKINSYRVSRGGIRM
jgi:ribosomal protein L19E